MALDEKSEDHQSDNNSSWGGQGDEEISLQTINVNHMLVSLEEKVWAPSHFVSSVQRMFRFFTR